MIMVIKGRKRTEVRDRWQFLHFSVMTLAAAQKIMTSALVCNKVLSYFTASLILLLEAW